MSEFVRSQPAVTWRYMMTTAMYYMMFDGDPAAGGNNAFAADTIFAWPFTLPRKVTLDRIGAKPQLVGAGGLFRIGIYRDSGAYPAALVLDAGEMTTDAATYKETTINTTLNPNILWGAFIKNTLASNFMSNIGTWHGPIVGAAAADPSTAYFIGYSKAQTYGALPDPFPSGAAGYAIGSPYLRILLRNSYVW